MSHEIRTAADRTELVVDGQVVSWAEFHDRGRDRAIVHTVTEQGYEGHGLAGELVTAMLDEIRAEGRGLLPLCPYVQHLLETKPEYVDLVPPERRQEFGL